MSRDARIIGRILKLAFGTASVIGGIALFVLAARWMPSDPHHGQAVDGLDGIDKVFALLVGGGGLIALVIGGLVLRSAIRSAPMHSRSPP